MKVSIASLSLSQAIAALCFFATVAAEADAEADAHYGYYGHPLAYGLPYAFGYHPYAFGHYYGKRSADAEADPYYLGGYALPYAAHGVVAAAVPFGSSTGLDPITQGLDASTQGYAPYAYGYLGHYYG